MELLIEEMDAADIAIGVVPIRQENDNNDIARIKEQYPGVKVYVLLQNLLKYLPSHLLFSLHLQWR